MSTAPDLPELTMSYEGLVEAGRAAREHADDVQWTEGDLALQVEHLPPNERPRDPETGAFLAADEHALKRYAADIDVNYSTLQNYRTTAAAWPPSCRQDGAGFETHRILASQDDRFDLIHEGMTAATARRIVRDRSKATTRKPGWFELLGQVGDDLKAMQRHLDKAEHAIDRAPNKDLRVKAGRYAEWADDIAARLRRIEGWSE